MIKLDDKYKKAIDALQELGFNAEIKIFDVCEGVAHFETARDCMDGEEVEIMIDLQSTASVEFSGTKETIILEKKSKPIGCTERCPLCHETVYMVKIWNSETDKTRDSYKCDTCDLIIED
jgi:hypothetical protein